MKSSTTQQINDYLQQQRTLRGLNSLLLALKKADHTRQSNRSAFNNQVTNISNVNYSNQSTHGVN